MTRNLCRTVLIQFGCLLLSGRFLFSAERALELDHLQWRDDLVIYEGDNEFGEVWHQYLWIEKKVKGGTAQAYIKNSSPKPIALLSVKLNGEPIEAYRERCDVSYWNLKPGSLPSGETGSLLIRFKEKPTEKIKVEAFFSENQQLAFEVDPQTQSPGFRFESFGFAQDRSKIVVYFRRFEESAGDKIENIWLNGKKVGGFFSRIKTSWISEEFINGLAAVEVSPAEMPPVGSYVYFKAQSSSGKIASYVIRVSDGFVQYGVFDEPDIANLPNLAMNNMNTVSAHRLWSQKALDTIQKLGMRAVSYLDELGGKGNPTGPLNHPAYDSIYSIDEPDVWDYGYIEKYKPEIPYPKRPGYLGMTVAKDLIEIQNLGKGRIQPSLVVDNTVRPWNWFEYGELPDMICSDNYTLPNSTSIFLVVKQQLSVMSAVAPLPVVHAYETTWHEFDTTVYRRFNRPKTAGEFRRLLLYPLGAGAKGLTGWWNVTDFNSYFNTWATHEFPDQWAVQAKTFAEIGQIAPLIAIGYPWEGATANHPKAWTSMLVAGKESLLLFVGNEAIRYTTCYSLQKPLENLEVTIPSLQWMAPVRAVKMSGFDQIEIPVKRNPDGTTTLLIGKISDCEAIVVSSSRSLPEKLRNDYLSSRHENGGFTTELLRAHYQKGQEDGRISAIRRDLKLNRQDQLIRSYPLLGGKEDNHPNFSNPKNESKNATGWFTQSKLPEEIGFSVPFSVRQGGEVLFAFQLQAQKTPIDFCLYANQQRVSGVEFKKEVFLKSQWIFLSTKVPKEGDYELRGIQHPRLDEKRVIPGVQYWPDHVPMPPLEAGKEMEVRTGYASKWVYFIPGITLDELAQNQVPSEAMANAPRLLPMSGIAKEQLQITNAALEKYVQGEAPTRIAQSTQTGKKFSLDAEKICADRIRLQPSVNTKVCEKNNFWFSKSSKQGNAVESIDKHDGVEYLIGHYSIEAQSNDELLLVLESEVLQGEISPRLEQANGESIPLEKAMLQLSRIDDHAALLGVKTPGLGKYRIAMYRTHSVAGTTSWISAEAAALKEDDFLEALYKLKQAVRIPKAEKGLYPMRTLKDFWE